MNEAPEGISIPDLPSTVPEYQVQYIQDSENSHAGNAIFDRETKVLTCYVHEGITFSSVQTDLVDQCLTREMYVIPLDKVLPMTMSSPESLRTCKFFTPSAETLKDTPAEISSLYEYDRPMSEPHCSHPDTRPNQTCDYAQQQCACPIFEVEEWQNLKGFATKGHETLPDETTVFLQKTRKGQGLVYYRSFQVFPDGGTAVLAEEDSAIALRGDHEKIVTDFDALPEDNEGLYEIAIEREAEVKVEYYEYALSVQD